MTTIKAHFDGKTFVPDEPVDMPVNTQVTLLVEGLESAQVEGQLKALEELEKLADSAGGHRADWSRESIYSGTRDDPR